jgi:ketosteroid isomerase-like protein
MPTHPIGTLALALSLTACASLPGTDATGVIQAELAFARLADEIGVRPAFVANFADDAVWLLPAPTTLAAAHAARPAPADPRAVRLQWHPAIAGVAASGDLGYSSGPSTISMRDGSRSPSYGMYFSMWKRGSDDRWLVALDTGVSSPTPVPDAALQPSPAVRASRAGAADRYDAIAARERAGVWDGTRFRAALADDARLLRNDAAVLRGAAEIATALNESPIALEPLGGAVARSADLAYSYGRFMSGSGARYYVHVWTRDAGGDWRLAIVVRP